MNAYDVIATMGRDGLMDNRQFYQLVRDFRTGWLSQENYAERLALHRQPIVLKNEMLRKLDDYFQKIQGRPEMRSASLDGKGSAPVPSIVIEMRSRDKRIQSLYEAVLAYGRWSKADLLTTAVHMAECRAIFKLIMRFRRETTMAFRSIQPAKTVSYNERESNRSFFRFAEEHEALKKQYRIKDPVTRQEALQHPRLIEGMVMSRNPDIPDDPVKALELFRKYYAQVQCLYQKDYFFNKYRIWNEASVMAEIQAIEKWINEARKLSYAEVCERKDFTNEQQEFLRLENGFYEGFRMSWDQCHESSTTARVYGRYILFLTYLKGLLVDLKMTRSNYRDVHRNVIPEMLALPEVQRRILLETRMQVATLPLDVQWSYYQAILVTFVHRKKDYLSTGGTDVDQIRVFEAEIKAAELELAQIERVRAADLVPEVNDNHREQVSPIEPKPVFKEVAREQIFDILKDHFPVDQQPELQHILKTGDSAPTKLHFRGNGVILLDFFKRLVKGQLVISVSKAELQSWICRNFTYCKQSTDLAIRPKYAERVISGSREAAKGKRLIDVGFEGGAWTIHQSAITNRAERVK